MGAPFVAVVTLLFGLGGLYLFIQPEVRRLFSGLSLALIVPAICIALWWYWWAT
jgi:hypothetical protein